MSFFPRGRNFLGSGLILDDTSVNFPLTPFRIGRDFLLMFITKRLYYGSESNVLQRSLSGRSPALEYIQSLAKPERARVLEGLEQVERRGLDAVRVQFRQVEGKLWEVKIGSHRVFYVIIERDEMVLLHAYKKQGQKLPVKERDIAIRRMKELLS